ncbi:MAG: glutathione S-transferase family protein [Myxococcota bacterium]
MSYIIYGAPGTGSGIIEAVCAEIGVDYEVRTLDARNNEHRGEAFAALNPHRKMPALETEDGEVLTESVAIVLALDERHREAELLPPPGSRDRAQALRWMLFLATEIYPLVELIDYPARFTETDPDALKRRAEALTEERWRIVEANVSGAPYFLASGFTATDLFITKMSVWSDPEWRRENLPKIEILNAAVLARSVLAPVWARHIR